VTVNAAVGILAAVCLAYFALLIVALGHLTGRRRQVAQRHVPLLFFEGWVLIDWLSGATNWVMVEGIAVVIAIPVAAAHIANLLREEYRGERV
jgi:hypothetical protein